MISAGSLLLAYVADRAWGEPPTRVHPVAWIGRASAIAREWALDGTPSLQLLRGTCVALSLPACVGAIGYLIEVALNPLPWLWLLVAALLLKPMFAVRALRDAAFAVRDALEAGDLERARHGLRSLCSRDASQLGESDLSAATIESVAENASDSIVAPLLFFAVFGLPGAAIYRTVNTLDAMIGYRGRFEWAGKASARLDDVLNLVPARVTAWSFMLVAEASGGNLRKGIATWWRDAGRTESPNAGRPMAAMAGLLGVRLNKQGHYTLGAEHRPARAEDISRAWRIVSLASTLVALLSALLAGALHG